MQRIKYKYTVVYLPSMYIQYMYSMYTCTLVCIECTQFAGKLLSRLVEVLVTCCFDFNINFIIHDHVNNNYVQTFNVTMHDIV